MQTTPTEPSHMIPSIHSSHGSKCTTVRNIALCTAKVRSSLNSVKPSCRHSTWLYQADSNDSSLMSLVNMGACTKWPTEATLCIHSTRMKKHAAPTRRLARRETHTVAITSKKLSTNCGTAGTEAVGELHRTHCAESNELSV
eukprot:129156-Prymnesium_polylepis.5